MATGTRTDVHRPSEIRPEDYEFVGVEYSPDEKDDIGAAMVAADERKRIRQHMQQTGGTYSRHRHGGNCHVCGAHCVYSTLWYHPTTNAYIRMGFDCTEKMFAGDVAGFRPVRSKIERLKGEVRTARENRAGRMKAKLLLDDEGLQRAWEIYTANDEELIRIRAVEIRVGKSTQCPQCYPGTASYYDGGCDDCRFGTLHEPVDVTKRINTQELDRLIDVIDSVVRYGNLSDKQTGYIRKLIDWIDNRADRQAEREARIAAERAAAEDCPAARTKVTGVPLSAKSIFGQYGQQDKWLVRDDRGFKVFGSIPASIREELVAADVLIWNRDGDRAKINPDLSVRVSFDAKIEPSKDDAKFGFYSRPTKARVEIEFKASDSE